MAIIIHKGIKENGLIDAEIKRTPVLVTELIHDFPKLCEFEIRERLREIRESSERDERISMIYVDALKKKEKS